MRECPGAFVFRHAITREILYHELLAFQTRTIHREIAERLERTARRRSLRPRVPLERGRRPPSAASAAYERAGDARCRAMRPSRRRSRLSRRARQSRRSRATARTLLSARSSRARFPINGEVDEACAFAERAVNAYAAAGGFIARGPARRFGSPAAPTKAEAGARRIDRAARSDAERRQRSGRLRRVRDARAFRSAPRQKRPAAAYLASAEETPGEHSALDRRNARMVRALVAATSGRAQWMRSKNTSRPS